MSGPLAEIEEAYLVALRDYVSRGGEASLHDAYELGRRAIESGSAGVLDVAAVHHDVLSALVRSLSTTEDAARLTIAAAGFLAEALSPFEMAQLGFREANAALATANRELEEQTERAQIATQAKSEFLSRMSHELRTPLNAVLGFAQLLELDELSPDQRENVAFIRRAGKHLLELINEVLDISRIETGQMTISPESVDVVDMLTDVVALTGPLAQGRSIAIAADEVACGHYVLADRQRLRQVLLNLVANAVKYNREGGSVAIDCRLVGAERLQLRVSDTGYGIAPEQHERLFTPFERLGAEASGVEGTGMGLALSKGLVEAMGGAIGLESEVDVGTTFWVELGLVDGPLEAYERAVPTTSVAPETRAGQTRHRILHIEDNASNLRLVERILARHGDFELLTAMQGRLGLALAREHRPDIVLLDLHLPDLHGRDVLRELRRDPATRAIPIIVISADATKTQIERLARDGASGYLTKPLDVAAFLELLTATLAAGTGEAS